ncbi:MAG: hypothetical protein L6R37_007047 [Teloschistes peruensis]|nr:MAG: hypothetical protein L6R37_007047 [Teloschistes peruensis]
MPSFPTLTRSAYEPAESPSHRSYFYVGGKYTDDGKDDGQHIFTDQMYMEHLLPANGIRHTWPLVFIQSAGQTATGYVVYLLDQTCRGRSSYHHSHGPTVTYPAEPAEKQWTACRDFLLWPEAALHTQWPGSGRMDDPIFDAYYASTVPSLTNYAAEQTLMHAAGVSLLDRIGPAILITHSQDGTHGWLWADARPNLVKVIVAIEPSGPPFQSTIVKDAAAKQYGITDTALSYDPPPDPVDEQGRPLQSAEHIAANEATYWLRQEPARRLTNLIDIPVLLETGEVSSHASYDLFTVQYLRQAGVNVEHLKLADKDIHGKGHLQFLELNNMDIIQLLEKWIALIT